MYVDTIWISSCNTSTYNLYIRIFQRLIKSLVCKKRFTIIYTDIYTFQLLYIDRYSIRLAIFESSQSAHTHIHTCARLYNINIF